MMRAVSLRRTFAIFIRRLLGKAPDRVPANINWLYIRLRGVAPAAHNMSAKRFKNIKSDAIKALALTGCSRARADWLRLPAALVKITQQLQRTSPRKAALKLQAALAIEILLNAPMRIGNLSTLHLERHLRPIGAGRKRQVHIHIPAQEVKNDKAIDYLLPKEIAVLLDLYLTQARPVLEDQPSEYLFPAQKGGYKPTAHLSGLIKDTILEHTGLVINAHLFRSIAGKIHSLVQPGDFVTLSHVLNNSLPMAMKAYAQFERQSSLKHYQNSLEAARRGGAA